MREYNTPEIEVISLNNTDVIETSGLTPEDPEETQKGIFDGILEWI